MYYSNTITNYNIPKKPWRKRPGSLQNSRFTEVKSASLVVIRDTKDKQQALIAIKQVVNFTALHTIPASFKNDVYANQFCNKLRLQSDLTQDPIFRDLTRSWLLPAGGKPSYIGGKSNRADAKDSRKTAMREFAEEFGLQSTCAQIKSKLSRHRNKLAARLHHFHTTSWLKQGRQSSSHFHYINETDLKKLDIFLDTEAANRGIHDYLETFYSNGTVSVKEVPELDHLQWINLSQLKTVMAIVPHNFIMKQAAKLSEVVCRYFRIDYSEHLTSAICKHVKDSDTSFKVKVAAALEKALKRPV